MSRPQKINALYFAHDADMRNDVKVKALRRRFGHTGYAVWNYLLEALTDSDDFEIEYTPLNRELYAADFDLSTDKLDDILEYMAAVGLITNNEGVVYSTSLKQRLQGVADRKIARIEAGRLGGLRSGEARRRKANQCLKQNEPMLEAKRTNASQCLKQNEPKEKKVKESKIKESKVKYNNTDLDIVIDLWNSICTAFPKVIKLTDARRTKIKARLDEFPDDPTVFCEKLFERVQASNFLRGDNNQGWQATFDWLFTNSTNWVKVMEGNYDNRGRQTLKSTGLGTGEFIDDTGRRTYGSGTATIPADAPPRPSDKHYWNRSTKQWTI